MLGTLVLALDDDARGQMGDPDGRVGLVDVLAAGAGGTVRIYSEIVFVDIDRDLVVDFRVGEDRGEGRMPPAAGVEGRYPDQPVDARFGFGEAVGIVALDGQGDALDSRLVAGLKVNNIRLVALLLSPPEIHAQKHFGPVLGLRAACPGVGGHDGVQGILFRAEHKAQFLVTDGGLERRNVLFHFGEARLIVLLGGKLAEDIHIFQGLLEFLPVVDGGR
ncbi:MAG: hypothetical protein CSYNP_04336 [Syntrophus sp. SKADARSKE-3]|nr:hypothetical protein [Syntrophus sp. SKADARSKE-3]